MSSLFNPFGCQCFQCFYPEVFSFFQAFCSYKLIGAALKEIILSLKNEKQQQKNNNSNFASVRLADDLQPLLLFLEGSNI